MSTSIEDLPVLQRREIEARMLAPMIDALGAEFGRDRVIEIVRDTIISIAREQGAALAAAQGSNGLGEFANATKAWELNDALKIDVLAQDEQRYDFNVTRCRYAEMYRELGIPELGAVLSCNRDFSLIEGYNTDVTLTRTQTLMEGAACCDFRYRLK
ncbi:MAG: L-2-amino-thiazoline-4-carboxylic acid hydrolase [Gemmatimonadaceae bacterium]|nr:L-2-amino-thiazoline-4-carboxylic acid hydrolase [Gemmatimonadaceae bacterium]